MSPSRAIAICLRVERVFAARAARAHADAQRLRSEEAGVIARARRVRETLAQSGSWSTLDCAAADGAARDAAVKAAALETRSSAARREAEAHARSQRAWGAKRFGLERRARRAGDDSPQWRD